MTYKSVLLTDIDNTLFNWIDYFAPCFRAMVHALAHATGLEEDEVYSQFHEVYSRLGIAEYRYAIQELALYKSQSPEVQARLLRAGFVAFSRARTNRLRPYTSVLPTLRWLKQQEVTVVAVTNSWEVDAQTRLFSLGLSKYFAALVAWDGSHNRGEQPDWKLRRISIATVIPVPAESRKPSAEAYRMALAALQVDPSSNLWVIGDSLSTDLVPAKEAGATTIWAKYGSIYAPHNFETILRITHWKPDQIQSNYDISTTEADFAIDDFAQLRNIIPALHEEVVQGELFPEVLSP